MALYRLLRCSAFEPDEVRQVVKAYEDALSVLGFPSRDVPVTEIIAKKIIEVAQTGERDPARICMRAIEELGIPQAA
jgi:hypothetical protein